MGSLGAGHYFTGRGARGAGDDENQIGAHSALERLFSGIQFGMDGWGNWRLNLGCVHF